MRDRHEVVFQFFPWPQARDGDVLLPIVGVNRSFFFQRNAQILNRIQRCGDFGSICLQDPDVWDFNLLVG